MQAIANHLEPLALVLFILCAVLIGLLWLVRSVWLKDSPDSPSEREEGKTNDNEVTASSR